MGLKNFAHLNMSLHERRVYKGDLWPIIELKIVIFVVWQNVIEIFFSPTITIALSSYRSIAFNKQADVLNLTQDVLLENKNISSVFWRGPDQPSILMFSVKGISWICRLSSLCYRIWESITAISPESCLFSTWSSEIGSI